MKNTCFTNLSIDSVVFDERAIRIDWSADEKSGTLMLYRHADNSWHADSESAAMGRDALMSILRKFLLKALPEEKPEPKKKRAGTKTRRRDTIRVWRAEDASF